MPRRVFFSFHYDRDAWRVQQVRNSWVVKPEGDASPFLNGGEWEKVKRGGDSAIKKWIDDQMSGCGVVVVLIGKETSSRTFVKYEIEKAKSLGKGLLGIRIHNVKDSDGNTDLAGANPLDSSFKVYDWMNDNGRENISKWIEDAAKQAGR